MKLSRMGMSGLYGVEVPRLQDDRGELVPLIGDADKFEVFVNAKFSQSKRGVLRGFHYQIGQHEEGKLVYCLAGNIESHILDLRRYSPTYLSHEWRSLAPSANAINGIYIPPGCAHATLALQDSSVVYLTTNSYRPEAERGIRWDDPAFSIRWSISAPIVSAKDQSWTDFA